MCSKTLQVADRIRFFSACAFIILALLSIWANLKMSIFEEVRTAPELRWGFQAIADLYIGFCIFSSIYFKFEKQRFRAILWMLATFIFGNLASSVYLFRNAQRIAEWLET